MQFLLMLLNNQFSNVAYMFMSLYNLINSTYVCKTSYSYKVATLLNGCKHLVTTLKIMHLYNQLCKDYMASTLQKLVIPTFGYCNLSIPLLKHFIKDLPLDTEGTQTYPKNFSYITIVTFQGNSANHENISPQNSKATK